MNLSLTNKVAMITGASKGLGYSIARTLAAEGMFVAAAARNGAALAALVGEIEAAGGQGLAFAADLAGVNAAGEFVQAAMARFGRIDLVVNNAGATQRGDFLQLTDADWQSGFELKFHGAVRLCRSAWPHLVKTRGAIVNIAGVGGRTGSAEFTLGGSVNAAMALLTKALADRGVADGVRVNAINPGFIATDRLTARIEKVSTEESLSPEAAARIMAARERIARFGVPAEIADAVAFLASENAAYINGALIDIDGGLTRTM